MNIHSVQLHFQNTNERVIFMAAKKKAPAKGHSPQVSKKSGKNRNVSKNTLTKSRVTGNRQQKDS